MNYEQARTLKAVSVRSTEHERLIQKMMDRFPDLDAAVKHVYELSERIMDLENKVDQLLPEMTPAKPESRRVRLPRK